jgi:hypothetical protein
MDAELSRWVVEANNIGISGRWAAVNARIEQLCANPSAGRAWWVEVFSSLCASVFSEYLSLKRAHEDPRSDGSLIAWHARNLSLFGASFVQKALRTPTAFMRTAANT